MTASRVHTTQQEAEGLEQALRWLDRLLHRAVAAADVTYGPETASDPFRGLYVDRDDVDRLLASNSPGWPDLMEPANDTWPGGDASPLTSLASLFNLNPFDVAILTIALAPDLDLRYERIYAYLQDDVTRRRPTVDLALNLLCQSHAERLLRRPRFAADAPLIRSGLIHLAADPGHIEPSLLSHFLKPDDQIVRFSVGQDSADPRLVSFCETVNPVLDLNDVPVAGDVKRALSRLLHRSRERGEALRLNFSGPDAGSKLSVAEALARECRSRLIVVHLGNAPSDHETFERSISLVIREARLHGAILFLNEYNSLASETTGALPSAGQRYLLNAVSAAPVTTLVATRKKWVPFDGVPFTMLDVDFPIPDYRQRLFIAEQKLSDSGIDWSTLDVPAFASRFRLTPDQIKTAISMLRDNVRWRQALGDDETAATSTELFSGARAQCGHDLSAQALKLSTSYGWDDIVLAPDTLSQMQEICRQVIYQQRVLGDWGFDRKLSLGKGVSALFAGPSGTGKTMAAEVIANELEIDLYRIDLSQVISKYIGETEKNLDRIFSAARNANAILFFDEADALFGKRSEVRDSHDRYANIEISYLLQKMEEYDGIAILATNLRRNMDDAFVRRLAFIVTFSNPDEHERLRIWSRIWPSETPLSPDLDLCFMANQFKLSGGNICNIALAAAYLAAQDDQSVAMSHLLRATRREFRKMGKVVAEHDFGEYADVHVNGTSTGLVMAAEGTGP